jgi:hypothetical protein
MLPCLLLLYLGSFLLVAGIVAAIGLRCIVLALASLPVVAAAAAMLAATLRGTIGMR